MTSKTRMLIFASLLALGAMPFLYIGGQNGSTALMGLGFAAFCVGMVIAPVQFLSARSKAKQ